MQKILKAFVRDERGVSSLEYAILAGIVVLALIGATTGLSDTLGKIWGAVTTGVSGAAPKA